jgi:hypothetical protein
MYKEISDTLTEKLEMAYYRILEYRKVGIQSEEERLALGKMIDIGCMCRTLILKRM